MASLSQRLRSLQIPATTTVESLDHLRLEDLVTETISFGQKHQGHSYLEAWEDQEWIHFMINRYQGSTKESHRRFMRFIELKIEEMEQAQTVLPRRQTPSGQSRLQARPKPMAKSLATPISLQDGVDDWDVESEMFIPVTTAYASGQTSEEMMALQTRMLNMENALTRVIHHIEEQALQNKDHLGTEDA
jgi:hypothetical protein